MTNHYTQAVDLVCQFLEEITPHIWKDGTFPTMESKYEAAMRILRSHQDYDGKNPEVAARPTRLL